MMDYKNGWMELKMNKSDPTFIELESVKKEIREFIAEQFSGMVEQDRNNMISILKKVVLMKYLVRQNPDDFRLQALLSDLIYLVDSVINGEIRYYYFNMRSIIEQSLRVINMLDSAETIPNYDIMKKTEEIVLDSGFQFNLDIIKYEYSKSCHYVHGSSNANMNLVKIYSDCLDKSKYIDNLNQKLNELVKLLKEIFRLVFLSNSLLVDAAFHRRKSILKYLTDEYSLQLIVNTQK